MFRALIVEDDGDIADLIELTLRMQWPGGSCSRVGDGQSAVTLVRSQDPDLILLNPGLATQDGLDALKEIRRFSMVPIVVLIKKGEETERIRGIELGADEYVREPFSPLELLARALATVRPRLNQRAPTDSQMSFDDGYLAIDFSHYQAAVADRPIYLTAAEFRLLSILVRNRGCVVAQRSLVAHVWGYECEAATDFLRVYIRRIREEIEPDPDAPAYLITERGKGYRFVSPDVREGHEPTLT